MVDIIVKVVSLFQKFQELFNFRISQLAETNYKLKQDHIEV